MMMDWARLYHRVLNLSNKKGLNLPHNILEYSTRQLEELVKELEGK